MTWNWREKDGMTILCEHTDNQFFCRLLLLLGERWQDRHQRQNEETKKITDCMYSGRMLTGCQWIQWRLNMFASKPSSFHSFIIVLLVMFTAAQQSWSHISSIGKKKIFLYFFPNKKKTYISYQHAHVIDHNLRFYCKKLMCCWCFRYQVSHPKRNCERNMYD